MSSYLQMGHDTENLVGEDGLEEFSGIVLSPVNRTPKELVEKMAHFRKLSEYDIILDPQVYYPRGLREKLIEQPYFPSDFDTRDFSTPSGWTDVLDQLMEFAKELGVDAIASPAILPRRWTDDFYDLCVETCRLLSERARKAKRRALLTCIVSLADLESCDRAMRIGSIMTRFVPDGYYLVLDTEIEPRRELADANGLANMMRLISMLQRVAPVMVAYSSSDMILHKAAGAAHCGTSKFFNLRRFTRSRFDEPPTGGGGQLPYWFEHSLLAFIREADIRRLERDGFARLLGTGNSNNIWGEQIFELLETDPGAPWVGLSWRQYLSWFGKTEAVLDEGESADLVTAWLHEAEQNWLALENEDILFDEPRNNGGWIRPWRQAVSDFLRGR